jgi:hypothetical protein
MKVGTGVDHQPASKVPTDDISMTDEGTITMKKGRQP